MKINPEIFKAYDIRGVYGKDFDEETAYLLGLAYSKMRKDEEPNKNTLKIVVGEDMRLSSTTLKENLIKGLRGGGCDVVDIGLASTPTFYFAVANFKYDGGILVSASHNPKEYNGFKIVRDRALPVSRDSGMFVLRDMLVENKLEKSELEGGVIKKKVIEEHVKHDLKYSKIDNIKKFKIVIDTANGMGALYFDELFKYVPGEIIKLNWKLDGTFPAHEADPFKDENLVQIKNKVLEEKADLGITTDGDGDRIFFIDNKGELVEPNIMRAILCSIFLKEKPGSKIVYDIRPGRITEDAIRDNGGIPILAPVGHSLIKEIAVKEKAIFAGESSGHFFLNMDHGCYEVPMIVTTKLLEELSKSGATLSQYVKPYRKYFHSGEINTQVEDPDKIIEAIREKYKDGKQNNLDILSVEYPEYWFNIRKSNTEPLLRFTLEAKTKELMEEKRDEILKIIRK